MNVTLSVESSLGDLLQRLIDHHACFLAERALGLQKRPGQEWKLMEKTYREYLFPSIPEYMNGNRLDKSSINGWVSSIPV